MPSDPPRFRWLLRLGLLALAWLGGWAGMHFWFVGHVEAMDHRLLTKWRDDGGPHPNDAAPPVMIPPTGADNAAVDYAAALAAIPALTPSQLNWYSRVGDRYPFWTPLDEEDLAAIRSIEQQNKRTLELVRIARDKPEVDWGVTVGLFPGLSPRLNPHRHLADHLSWIVALRFHEGDLANTLERLRDMDAHANTVVHDGTSFVSGLVTTGIQALLCSRVQELLIRPSPGMSAAEDRAAWRDARPQASALIDDLLDTEPERSSLATGLRGERVHLYNALSTPGLLGPPGPATGWYHPFIVADVLQTPDALSQWADIAEDSDSLPEWVDEAIHRWPQLVGEHAGATVAGQIAHQSSRWAMSSIDRFLLSMFRGRAQRRGMAILLAVRMYEADHDGELPPTLDVLVPEYLPFVPNDPFAAGNQPMRYRTDLALPVVYSIGPNLKDDGASVLPLDATGQRQLVWGVNRYNSYSADYVFPLRPSPLPNIDEWNYLYDGGKARQRELDAIEQSKLNGTHN